MGDELLLNFGAKFQRYFVISQVKLQNCHGNRSVRVSRDLKIRGRGARTATGMDEED